jgi:chromosomal replication initiation ATPase DnaA
MAIRSFGIDLAQISGPARGGATVTFARHTAMYLAVIEGRLTLTEVARQFVRDRRAVAYGIARLEQRRDVEAAFDDGMTLLTNQFRQRLDDLQAYYRITGTARAV